MLLPSQALTLEEVTAMTRSINQERVETEEPLRDGDPLASVDLENFTPIYQRNGTLCYFVDLGLFHKSIVFYDTKKLVYFTNESFPEIDSKKCCTNKILNLDDVDRTGPVGVVRYQQWRSSPLQLIAVRYGLCK